MDAEMLLVFGLLVVTVVLFVSDRLRLDLVAIMLVITLMLTNILTPAEALAGFADPVVLMIAGLFVVGEALRRTGVADSIGYWLGKVAGTQEITLIATTMAVAAFLSGFMSSTGTTAVLLPIVVSLARNARVNPAKLLIPLAFASLLGGMLTLIGTPPNIVVSNQLSAHGYAPFGFFAFTPVGLIMLALGLLFMIFAGRHLLPDRARTMPVAGPADEALSIADLAQAYQLTGSTFRLRIRRSSPLLGQSLADAHLRRQYGVTVLEIQKRASKFSLPEPAQPVTPETVLDPFDILHVQGTPEAIRRLAREQDFAIMAEESSDGRPLSPELGMVEALLPPRSRLLGYTLSELRFRDRYGVTVLGIMRLGKPLTGDLRAIKLQFSDTLLLEGSWDKISLLRDETQNFIVVGQPLEMEAAQRPARRAGWAIAIMLGMLLLMTFEVVPAVTAVLLAAAAMVLTGCLTMEDAYRGINWESVVLIAGMLPMATALQKTGGITYIADSLVSNLGGMGPIVVMAGLFVLTSLFSQFISNTATAVLMAPIALQSAISLGLDPHAFLMTVAVAASTSFATPVASPVNTLVLGPGGYRFGDYVKVGVSLQLLIMIASLLVLPIFFPF